jgi:hypothetical protein
VIPINQLFNAGYIKSISFNLYEVNVATACHKKYILKCIYKNVKFTHKKRKIWSLMLKQYPTVSYAVTWQKNNGPNIKKWKITIIFTRQKNLIHVLNTGKINKYTMSRDIKLRNKHECKVYRLFLQYKIKIDTNAIVYISCSSCKLSYYRK